MTAARHRDTGFTLIEMVIAMLIMSIAVVTIVGALSTMITLTSEHRGHAAVEDAAHSFSQAVQAQAQFSTKLHAAVTNASATTISVDDASLIPPGSDDTAAGVDTFLIINREVMHVDHVDRSNNTVKVDRHITGTPPASGHAQGDAVVPFTRCGGPALFTPDPSTYQSTPGLTTTVTTVEYWKPATGGGGSWVNQSTCKSDYTQIPSPCATNGYIGPECGSGFRRVTLAIKSSDTSALNYDKRFRGVDTTTQVLVRRASA